MKAMVITMWMIIFLLLPVLAILYIGWHLWVLIPLPAMMRWLVIGILTASFLLLFLNFTGFLERQPLAVARWSYDIGSSSVFILLYLTLIFIVLDLGRLMHLVPRSLLFHNFYTTVCITILMFVVFLLGNIHYYNKQRVELTLKTSKTLEKPLRLVLISDLHLGYHNPRKELSRWVDMMNAEKPDLVLIAGDIIDKSMRPLQEEHMADEWHRVEAPVYACLGNHDYFSREPAARRFFKEAGICLLKDSVVTVGDLVIIGRDDRTNRDRLPLSALMKMVVNADSLASERYTVVLDHQPYHLEEAELAGVDFQFSGHTHHGQVWPISWITDAVYECAFGAYQRGQTRYYVSSGLGIWGGKYRIGTRSEYVVATVASK